MEEGSTDFLREGQHIYAGDQIGIIGNTGNSIGAHLHLAFYVNNENPDAPYSRELPGYSYTEPFTKQEFFSHENSGLVFFNPPEVIQTQGQVIVETMKELSKK